MTRIRITIGELTVTAGLNDSHTARMLLGSVPFESEARRWGNEVYFETAGLGIFFVGFDGAGGPGNTMQ